MNFNKSISFQKQNSIEENFLYNIKDNYYIEKSVNVFSFFIKNGIEKKIIQSYCTCYYVYPKANIVILFNGKKWLSYVYNEKTKEYVMQYISNYFILSFKLRLLIKKDSDFYVLCKFNKTDIDIVIDSVLLSFTNFIIDDEDKKMYFINERMNKKLVYDMIKDSYTINIIKGDNVLVTKKIKIYFDNIGGIEIYKKDKLIDFISRYYKLEKFLYILKKNDGYILMDMNNHTVLFIGKTLHIINNTGWIIDKSKNEIALITDDSVDILSYDKYINNERNPLNKYKRKNYRG